MVWVFEMSEEVKSRMKVCQSILRAKDETGDGRLLGYVCIW